MPGNRTLLILGLEAANLERLTAGDPIVVKAEAIEELQELAGGGAIGGIVILAGATRADIRAEFLAAGLIGDETVERAEGPPERRQPPPAPGGGPWPTR